MKKDIRLLLVLLAGLMALAACEKSGPECYEPVSILTRNAFQARQVIHIDSFVDSINIDTTIIVYADTGLKAPAMYSLGMEKNIAIMGTEDATSLGVPFDPANKNIRYAIQFDTAIANYDTITYYYTASNHFISNECGFTNYYYIDSIKVTNHTIDSFAIIKRSVTLGNDKQVILYFF